MSQNNPWSIKGIKSNNRETAKEIAGKNGLTLGELVNRLIEEADSSNPQNINSNSNNYLKANEMPNTMPNANSSHGFENSRLAQAMEDLNRKLEAVNNNGFSSNSYAQQSPQPIMQQPIMPQVIPQAVPQYGAAIPQRDIQTERAIDGLLRRIEDSELRADRNGHNINTSLNDIKNAQETIKDRLARIERDDPSNKSLSALRNLEIAMEKIALQVANNEKKIAEGLSPKDVEALLNNGLSSVKSGLNDSAARLESIETITTQAIEQTNKGIILLSDRVLETEKQAQQINQVLKDSLIDLSARLTDIESQSIEELKTEITENFEKKLRSLEIKYSELNRNINQIIEEKIAASQNDSINAIENISEQLVSSNQSLNTRLKKIEEYNQDNIDNSTSLRLELGKVSLLVNERLEQIEKRDNNLFENVSSHVETLTQKIDSRIANIELQTSDIISHMEKRNRNFEEQIESHKQNFTSEIERRIAETEQRLNNNFHDKYDGIKQEIYSTEERFKDNNLPIKSGLELILSRLEGIENKANAKHIETLKSPDFTYKEQIANKANIQAEAPINKDAEETIMPFSHDFGSAIPAENIEEFDDFDGELESFSDIDELDNLDELDSLNDETNDEIAIQDEEEKFLSDFGKDFDELAQLGPDELNIIEHDEIENEFNISNNEDWEEEKIIPEKKLSKNDYLNNAREAAKAASAENSKKSVKPKPNSSTKAVRPSKMKKASSEANKLSISPLALTAAGAILFVAAFGAYQFFKPKNNTSGLITSPEASASVNVKPPVIAAPPAEQTAVPIPPAQTSAPIITQENTSVPNEATPPSSPVKSNADGMTPNFKKAPVTSAPDKSVTKTTAANSSFANSIAKPLPAKPIITQNEKPIAAKPNTPSIATSSSVKPVKATSSSAYNEAITKINAGDKKAGFELMQRAASAGDVRAQNRIARMYEKGDGVEPNMALARQWTQKAANAGSKTALHNLGTYYSEGNNSVQDLSRAADYYKKAAKKGSVDSQYNLGAMAELGIGTNKNPKDAYYWYSLAAKGGDTDAGSKAASLAKSLPAKEKEAIDKNIIGFKPEASID